MSWSSTPGLAVPGLTWPGSPGVSSAAPSPSGPPVLLDVAAGAPSAGWIDETGSTDLMIPLYGLAGVDLTTVTVEFALTANRAPVTGTPPRG